MNMYMECLAVKSSFLFAEVYYIVFIAFSLLEQIRSLPGNDVCADCDSPSTLTFLYKIVLTRLSAFCYGVIEYGIL